MRAKYILVLAFVVACSSKHSTTGDDAPNGTDSSMTDSMSGDAGGDGMSTVDGGVGVACGMATCMGTQECCLANGTRTCVDQGKCRGIAFACDGPEDCPTGDVCCAGNTGGMPGSKCEPKTDVCRAVACHADPDCPTAQPKCCKLGPQSQLEICLAQCPMM